jgi:hypothetical protein
MRDFDDCSVIATKKRHVVLVNGLGLEYLEILERLELSVRACIVEKVNFFAGFGSLSCVRMHWGRLFTGCATYTRFATVCDSEEGVGACGLGCFCT